MKAKQCHISHLDHHALTDYNVDTEGDHEDSGRKGVPAILFLFFCWQWHVGQGISMRTQRSTNADDDDSSSAAAANTRGDDTHQ